MRIYIYRIKSTGGSSAKFGSCEVCKHHVTEVFYQVESTTYTESDGTIHPTYHGCTSLFGHEECLRKKRR